MTTHLPSRTHHSSSFNKDQYQSISKEPRFVGRAPATTAEHHSMSSNTTQHMPGAYPDFDKRASAISYNGVYFNPHTALRELTSAARHAANIADEKVWAQIPRTGAVSGSGYIPGPAHGQLGHADHHHADVESKWDLPTKEHPSGARQGVGSLPGPNSESGVAKLPEEKAHEDVTPGSIDSKAARKSGLKTVAVDHQPSKDAQPLPMYYSSKSKVHHTVNTTSGGYEALNREAELETDKEKIARNKQYGRWMEERYGRTMHQMDQQVMEERARHPGSTYIKDEMRSHVREEVRQVGSDWKEDKMLNAQKQKNEREERERGGESMGAGRSTKPYVSGKGRLATAASELPGPTEILHGAEHKAYEMFHDAEDALKHVGDTARHYLEESFGVHLPSETHDTSASKTKSIPILPKSSRSGGRYSPPELPTREHPSGPHHFGVGSLPGPNSDEAVALLPEEWKKLEMPTTEVPSNCHHAGVGSLPGKNTEEGVALLPDEWQEEEMPTTEEPGLCHHQGVGSLPGRLDEAGVAILPDEKLKAEEKPRKKSRGMSKSLPGKNQVGMMHEKVKREMPSSETPGLAHNAGVGSLPGNRSESGVAILPDERGNSSAKSTSTISSDLPPGLKTEYMHSPLQTGGNVIYYDEEAKISEGTLPGYPSREQMQGMMGQRGIGVLPTAASTTTRSSQQQQQPSHGRRGDTPFAAGVGDAPRMSTMTGHHPASTAKGDGLKVDDLGQPINGGKEAEMRAQRLAQSKPPSMARRIN